LNQLLVSITSLVNASAASPNRSSAQHSKNATHTEEPHMNNYHISATESGWELRKEGATRASKSAATKDEMLQVTAAFLEGKMASVKIHKKDGSIQEERTYPRSADPHESKG
jgi:hypothetical protein